MYYLVPHVSLGGNESVVDFSQISAIPTSEYSQLINRRVLQLLDRERVKFKIKLAAYLGRLSDDEAASGLQNPWQV